MLNLEQRENLRQALIKAYIEEHECKYKSSTSDGPLGIGCDPHADIKYVYISPFLPGSEKYREALDTNPWTEEADEVINEHEGRAWDVMMEVEKELLNEMIDHLRKQLTSITQ